MNGKYSFPDDNFLLWRKKKKTKFTVSSKLEIIREMKVNFLVDFWSMFTFSLQEQYCYMSLDYDASLADPAFQVKSTSFILRITIFTITTFIIIIMVMMMIIIITMPLSGGECPSTWRKHDRDGSPEVFCTRDYIPGDNMVMLAMMVMVMMMKLIMVKHSRDGSPEVFCTRDYISGCCQL